MTTTATRTFQRKQGKHEASEITVSALLPVPALVLYFVFFILPSLLGIGYSFTDWSTYSEEINYVGLENFQRIFSPDENYLAYIGNTLLFTAVTIVLKTVIGLGSRHPSQRGRAPLHQSLQGCDLPAGRAADAGRRPDLPFHPSSRDRRAELLLRGIGLDGLAWPWLIDPENRALFRDRRRYLEGRRIHHGHPSRRPSDHSAETTTRPPRSTAPASGRGCGT